jgi:hypothetical protein
MGSWELVKYEGRGRGEGDRMWFGTGCGVERGARVGGAIGGHATSREGRSSGRSRREKSGGGGVG